MDKTVSHETREHHLHAMRTDIETTLKRLDKDAFERHVTLFRQRAIGLVNYISYFNALQSERAKHGPKFLLLPEVRWMLRSRTTHAVDDCHGMVDSFAKTADLLQVSGTSEVIERHLPQVLKAGDPHAIHRKIIEYCSAAALTEHQITKPLSRLAGSNYNVLAIGNGTIAGLVTKQQELVPSFTKLEGSIQLRHSGLSIRDVDNGTVDPPYQINGGGDAGGDTSGPVIIIIGIIVIIGYAMCQLYNAYHSTEPGFEPADCYG